MLTVPPNIVDDESSSSTVAVREGLNTSLTCKAKGNPEPKIVWKRENGFNITVDKRKKGKSKLISLYSIVKYLNLQSILENNTLDIYFNKILRLLGNLI